MGALGYAEAVAALERALVFGIHPSLDGIHELTEALGRPQESFASVQVAGTNGKTSTARITAAVLAGQGRRTGLYTSPHLERYPERIEVDGRTITDEAFAAAVTAAADAARALRGADAVGAADGFTEFELLTAAALWHFGAAGVSHAVLEVGLGGRWDATSVVAPAAAVITGIGLDHAAILGDTLEQIAAEKAAVIKAGSVAVLGPGTTGLEPIFLEQAAAVGARVWAVREHGAATPVAEELTVRYRVRARPGSPMGATLVNVDGVRASYASLTLAAPAYQAANVATAVAAAEAALGESLDAGLLRGALRDVRLPGRFEFVRRDPPVVVDGSHNPQAAAVLAEAIEQAWPESDRRPDVVLGVLADKDAAGIVRALAASAHIAAVCAPSSERALPAAELAAIVARETGAEPAVYATVADALDALLPGAARGLVVTGSLTTAGEARRQLSR